MSLRLACIVQRFITVQIQVKTFHWQTHSYSHHKSADALVDELLDKIDEFVETYMGMTGRRLDFGSSKTARTIRLQNISERKLIHILKQFAVFLTKLDCEDSSSSSKKSQALSTDLLNIRDDILGLVHQTLYLLTLK